jgi:hypothetical protein
LEEFCHSALVVAREDRSQQVDQHYGLHGSRGEAAEGPGGAEGGRIDSVAAFHFAAALSRHKYSVIAGLDPAIHDAFQRARLNVRFRKTPIMMDARVKRGHDAEFVDA